MRRTTLDSMGLYLRFLAVCYLSGFLQHLADLFDLRLKFSQMTPVWKAWVIYLAVFDALATVGLWRRQLWGVALFLFIAGTQLVAYLGFPETFGAERGLVVFHVVTVAVYFALRQRTGRAT
jgi:hypothetical protein